MQPSQRATETFKTHLIDNPYPGRGVVVGRAEDGTWLLVYWIMGRSEHSRNRRFVADAGVLRTEPVDASKVADPSLIIYEAMLEAPGIQLVSNGDQTRTALDALTTGGTFDAAMATRHREPDAPNYTPRITALLDFRADGPALSLSLLKAGAFDAEQTDRVLYRPALPKAGYGLGLTTYMGDGSPLPSFVGDPLLLPLSGDADEVLDRYYEGLDRDNRIAVAVKRVDPLGKGTALLVRNRY